MQNFYFYINMLQKRMAQKNATEKTRKKSNIFNSTQYKNYYSWLREIVLIYQKSFPSYQIHMPLPAAANPQSWKESMSP